MLTVGPGGGVAAVYFGHLNGGDLLAGTAPPGTVPPGARRLDSTKVPLPDGRVTGLIRGTDGWFVANRQDGDTVVLELRHADAPGATVDVLRLSPGVNALPSSESWARVPAVLAVPPMVAGECWVVAFGPAGVEAHVLAIRDEPWNAFVEGQEEYGLQADVLPDRRTVAVQPGRFADVVLLWDPFSQEVVGEMPAPCPTPVTFADRLDCTGGMWAAGSDTLYRIDPESRVVTFATRLRDAPTGCYVAWIEGIGDGRRLLIGWNRRAHAGPVATASVGDVLELDVERLVAERVARFPDWTVHGVRRSGHVLIQAWGKPELWVAGVERVRVPTFPPRPAGARDWR